MSRPPRPNRAWILALALLAACSATPHPASGPAGPGDVAATYAEAGRWVEAAREIEIALRRQPDDPALLLQAGAIHERLGADARAAAAFETATRSAPQDPAVWAAWAAFEARRGRTDSAYVAWRRARALAPADRAIAEAFARAAEQAGLDDEARQARQGLARDPAP